MQPKRFISSETPLNTHACTSSPSCISWGALGSIVLTIYDWRYCRAVVGSARVSGVCPPATRRQRQCAFANSPAPWRSAHQQRALGVFICSEGSRSLYCGDAPAAVTMVCRNPLCERRSVRLSPICPPLVVIPQAVRAPALDRDQTALLTKLFNELDRNGDGKLVRRVTATAAKPERSAPRCHRCRSCCPASLCVHVCLQDIDEFKLFGKAISGKEVTDTQARCVQCAVRVALASVADDEHASISACKSLARIGTKTRALSACG